MEGGPRQLTIIDNLSCLVRAVPSLPALQRMMLEGRLLGMAFDDFDKVGMTLVPL